MIRFTVLVLFAISLIGCRLTARQAQNLSDGLAGIEAAQPRVADDPVASAALGGAHDHVEAIAENAPLPLPTRTPAAIAVDPTSYADDAQKAVQGARSVIPWWGWFAGAGAAVLGVLRFVPSMGGAVADTAWRLLAPAQAHAAEAERDTLATGFRELVGLIEGLRNDQTIATLKAKVTTRASSSVRDHINQLIPTPPI